MGANSARASSGPRKPSETALNREYDSLMEHCGAGAFVLDMAGAIQRVNMTGCRMLGMGAKTLIGKSLLAAAGWDELTPLFRAAREANAMQQREIHLPGPGGNVYIVAISPIGGDKSKRRRYLAVAHDVTELRRLETIRRDFVANVSHELRTPLASIRAMAETLQDGALQDPSVAEHFLGTIITEAQRLTRISEDLLILSDAESNIPEREPLSLSELVEEVVQRFQPQAQKAEIDLAVQIAAGLHVSANHDQMEQVIVNLVDNALKYTPSGGCVKVTAERQADRIEVHVADTGIGIQRKHLPRIFERFYRVDKARSRQSGGTGLGLSIVKNIVEAHNGQVTVQSEHNRGSVFTITLPIPEG